METSRLRVFVEGALSPAPLPQAGEGNSDVGTSSASRYEPLSHSWERVARSAGRGKKPLPAAMDRQRF